MDEAKQLLEKNRLAALWTLLTSSDQPLASQPVDSSGQTLLHLACANAAKTVGVQRNLLFACYCPVLCAALRGVHVNYTWHSDSSCAAQGSSYLFLLSICYFSFFPNFYLSHSRMMASRQCGF